jgi:Cu(I)/Ag(I) efflux system membrane fusion protein
MEIYSPELLRAQKELLQAIKDKDQSLIQPLRQQLVNLGMQPAEIQEVVKKGKPLSRVTVYSPCDGISSQVSGGRFGGPPAPGKMAEGGTQAAGENPGDPGADRGRGANETEPLYIAEGMYVDKGQSVFCIQNTDRFWAVLNVFTSDIWRIRPGDSVRLYADGDPATVLKRRVDLIAPYRSGDERTTRIRIYLDRIPRNWKVNTLIHGRILTTGWDKGVRVPASSVNRLGSQNVIWVQDKRHAHVFHARKVETGTETDDSLQILSGVLPGEKIVQNAAYMVDGDSFVR